MKIKTILYIAFILFFSFISAVSANKTEKKIYGRIIFAASDHIELKKGRTELTLYYSVNTKFIAMDGSETKSSIIKICQYAEAYYTIEKKKNILTKLIIKKESDCYK